ncbi:cytochrome P450 [Trametes coccinea BRFM310]|uniref:Cytochrome P450 n=1 Tax=Trametes coccinea (strain BRFM310) TaxID=1353009 RepID=A0A1Y2ILJ5_TRAC3|nr:cytochrome P450 [Trametes coccinea BRFM310]
MLSLATVLALPVAVSLYFLWTFLSLLVRQARSPLRHLPGPPSTSLFMGNLKELHDQENNGLVARWASSFGRAFVYRGFMGGRRLMLVDPVAVNYVMSRGYDYPKPDFVRDSLASMAAGYEGLLTAEGEMHRKQRKILNQAFSAAQVKSLSPVFWKKANHLRDIWISIVGSPLAYSTPADPLMGLDVPNRPENRDPEDAAPNNRDSSAVTTSCLPNPFASFVPSKSSPTFPLQTGNASIASATSSSAACKIDVLPWLARATLDVIGEAGFGYEFHSLDGAAEHRENQSELAQAFGVIFSTARKFRVMTILQVWFPVLRHFRTENSAMRQAMATMRKIGMELIQQRREPVLAATEQLVADAEKADNIEGDRSGLGRDLLSVLIRSNVAEVPSQRMSINEILCQISTFLAAGHETSSSSLTWTLFALARNPAVQAKLRAELRSLDIPADVVPSSPLIEQIMQLPYLDAVVRESLRLYAPISTTMRVASVDDVIPVSAPLVDRRGQTCEYIRVRRGDIISIPIQALNKSSEAWGADAEAFHPERWMRDSVSTDVDDILTRQGRRAMVQGLWGHMLTFGGGTPVNGNRSCIGYRFALSEIKIFLYVLVRDLGFSIDPNLEIEKKVNVITRPCVKSEPHRGNQMPLSIYRVPVDTHADNETVQ